MRYVDLGVSPYQSLEKNKKKRRKRIFLFAAGLLSATIIGFISYAFYWPLASILSQILKNPGLVLSFIRDPNAQLQSTDGKTNILLLGIDKRSNVPYTYLGPSGEKGHNGFLSDTIIVASYDNNSKKVSLISIPRDTWVDIPGWDNFPQTQAKINSAYSTGDVFGYQGGGLQLAKRVVSEHLDIPIHYGARIDFEGFEKMIDTLGGVDIIVDTSFDDYNFPVPGRENSVCSGGGLYCRYEHVHFDSGSSHMNGETALRFVRSRMGTNGEGSDFARARRQQKVIQAVIKKSLSLENIFNPLTLNDLFSGLGESIQTDFNLSAIPQVLKLAKESNFGDIQTLVIDPSSGLMVTADSKLYGGAYAIIPKGGDWSVVKQKVKEFLAETVAPEKK